MATDMEVSANRMGTLSNSVEYIRKDKTETTPSDLLQETDAMSLKILGGEPCDESVISAELTTLLDSLSLDRAVWTVQEPLRVTHQDGEFGWLELKSGILPISPCESTITFVTEISDEADIVERSVQDWLARNG